MVAIGAAYYANLDRLENWLLFSFGLFSFALGLGGLTLRTPDGVGLTVPFYHHAGLLMGGTAISVSLFTVLSRRNFLIVRLEIPVTSFAMVINSFSVGFLIDEMIVWSEMPSVESYQSLFKRNFAQDKYETAFNNFIQLHYSRCMSCFFMANVCLCFLYFRMVMMGLIVYDDLASAENEFIEPDAGQPDDQILANMDDGMFGAAIGGPGQEQGEEGKKGLCSCFGGEDSDAEDDMPGGYARAAPRQAERTSIKSAGLAAPARSSVRSARPVEAEERKSGPQQEKKEKKKKKKKEEEAAE